MTVQTNNNSISYVGNGSTVHFDYDYLILNASHLKVYFGDVLQTSGYVVSGVSSQTGGTVAFAVAPPNGTNIALVRDVPFLQLTDYRPYDAFPAESHERALDLLTMMAQQLKDELGRTMQHPVGGNKWDARGNEIINVGTGSSGTSAANINQVKYLIASEVGDDPSASASVRSRESLRRSYAEAGDNLVGGSFQAGFTLVNANDVALDGATGKAFSGPAGTYPAGTSTAGFVDSSPNLLSDGITDFADSTYADMVLAITTPITDHINVATWNIWSYYTIPNYYNHDWATTEKISDTVDVTLSEGVHIFGLQETLIPLGYEDDFLSRGFYRGINVRNRTDRLGYDGNPKTPLAYGNAILSSIPILETGGGNFAVQDLQEQGWALAVVDIGGDEVAFYCCHTTSHTSKVLLAQVQEMADIAAADPRSKVVVVGDFNTGDSGCQALVDSGLTMLNADGQYNTNNVGGTWYIDRIFYRGFSAHGNLRALSQPEKLGDHKPFFATLYI